MIKIQLVDDEPNILSALKRLLKPQGWEIHTFDKVEAALNALMEHDYAVIASQVESLADQAARDAFPWATIAGSALAGVLGSSWPRLDRERSHRWR